MLGVLLAAPTVAAQPGANEAERRSRLPPPRRLADRFLRPAYRSLGPHAGRLHRDRREPLPPHQPRLVRRPARHADAAPARRHVLDVPDGARDVPRPGRAARVDAAADARPLADLPAVPGRHGEPLGDVLLLALPHHAALPGRSGRDVVQRAELAGEPRGGARLPPRVDRPDDDEGTGRVRLARVHRLLPRRDVEPLRLRRRPGDAAAGAHDARLPPRRLRRGVARRALRRRVQPGLPGSPRRPVEQQQHQLRLAALRQHAVHAARRVGRARDERLRAAGRARRHRHGPLRALRPPRAQAHAPPHPLQRRQERPRLQDHLHAAGIRRRLHPGRPPPADPAAHVGGVLAARAPEGQPHDGVRDAPVLVELRTGDVLPGGAGEPDRGRLQVEGDLRPAGQVDGRLALRAGGAGRGRAHRALRHRARHPLPVHQRLLPEGPRRARGGRVGLDLRPRRRRPHRLLPARARTRGARRKTCGGCTARR